MHEVDHGFCAVVLGKMWRRKHEQRRQQSSAQQSATHSFHHERLKPADVYRKLYSGLTFRKARTPASRYGVAFENLAGACVPKCSDAKDASIENGERNSARQIGAARL
jgi:hypothetical protein